jgi:hypothetical protein
MIEALRAVIKRLQYPLEVMLSCVRWHVADLVTRSGWLVPAAG